MHDLPDSLRAVLSPAQRLRRDSAARTLRASRIADLAALDPASAIVMIENLRSSLDDALCLLGDVSR